MNNTPKYKKQRIKQAEDKGEKMQAKISATTEEALIKLDKLSFIKMYNFC